MASLPIEPASLLWNDQWLLLATQHCTPAPHGPFACRFASPPQYVHMEIGNKGKEAAKTPMLMLRILHRTYGVPPTTHKPVTVANGSSYPSLQSQYPELPPRNYRAYSPLTQSPFLQPDRHGQSPRSFTFTVEQESRTASYPPPVPAKSPRRRPLHRLNQPTAP